MKTRIMVLAMLATLACGDPAPHFETLADEMCKCTDEACAASVRVRARAFAESRRGKRDPSQEQRSAVRTAIARMKACDAARAQPK